MRIDIFYTLLHTSFVIYKTWTLTPYDGCMVKIEFYIPFNSILVISRQCMDNNEPM